MSTLKVNNLQVGQDSTATNNLTWFQPGSPDGTIRLGSGNAGSATSKFTFDKDGNLTCVGNINAASILAPIEGTLDDWIVHAGDTNTKFGFPAADQFQIETAGTPRLKILSGGVVLIGNTTSQEVYGTNAVQVQGTSGPTSSLSLLRHGNSPYLVLGSSGGSSLGDVNALTDDARIGQITFAGADGTDINTHSASIAAYVDGSVSSNAVPGRLTFQTSTGATESTRMVITSGGSINIGGDYTQTSNKVQIVGGSSRQLAIKGTEADIWMESTGPSGIWRILGSTGGNTHQFRIYDNTGGADRLNIDSSGRVILGDTSATNAHSNADDLVIGNTSSGKRSGITIVSGTSNDGNIHFSRGGSSGNANIKGQIVYTHASGNAYANSMRFYTDVTPRLNITGTGQVNIGGNLDQTAAPLCVTTTANAYGIRLQTGSNVVCDIVNNDTAGNSEIRGYYNNNTGTRGTGYIIEANGETYFNPGGNTGLNIKSDGKVGINHTAALQSTLHIKSHTNGWAGGIILEENHADTGWNIHPDDNDNLMFGRNTDTTTGQATHKFQIKSGGDVEIVDGNLVVANGHGVSFINAADVASGETVAGSVLDDYEEGTYTPTCSNLGDHTTHNDTYGAYTKIGDLVTVRFRYKWTNRSTNNGAYSVTVSLPFTGSGNQPGGGALAVEGCQPNNSDRTSYHCTVPQSQSYVLFRCSGANVSENSFNGAISTSLANGYFIGTVTYKSL